MLILNMRKLILVAILFALIYWWHKKNEVDLLKSEMGNEVTYYAKSNVRETMTVEINIEGSGFTCNVPPTDQNWSQILWKKFLIKLTLDPSGEFEL